MHWVINYRVDGFRFDLCIYFKQRPEWCGWKIHLFYRDLHAIRFSQKQS